jgi:pimeloyl-ACP methyl ester carboxylesterase
MNDVKVSKDSQTVPTLKRKGRRGCLAWGGIVIGILALMLALLAGWMWVSSAKAKEDLTAGYPPPGQMVDVGGYRLHINCQGSKPSDDSPTVVLEAGLSQYSLTWDHVQREVAKAARVCSYDRAGLGWSERSPQPRTVPYMADELQALLTNAGVAPPYVLVGHSLGGLVVRYYAHAHPEQVAGMVLVDAENEDQALRLPQALLNIDKQGAQLLRIPQLMSAIGILAQSPASYPAQFLFPLPAGAEAAYKALLAIDTRWFETALAEYDAEEASCAAMRSVENRSLGNIPLIVISASELALPANVNLSTEEKQQSMAAWAELQGEQVALSSVGKQVIAAGTGHFIHIDQPELVIAAIREVVEAARR